MTARSPELDLYAMMIALGHRDEAERPAATEGEIETAVAHWSEALEPMTAAAAPVRAPEGLWARIERSIGAATRAAEARSPSLLGRLWASVGLWRFAAAAAASIALLIALFSAPAGLQGPTYVAVLQAPDGDRRAGYVVEVSADRTVKLTPLGRTEAGAQKALEFWTLADKAKGPKSLGLVPGDRSVTIPADRLPSIAEGQLFEITLEPYSGSPIGRPTGPILYKGLAAATS